MSRKRYPIEVDHLPKAQNRWKVLRSVLIERAPKLVEHEWTVSYTSPYETALAFETTVDDETIALHTRIEDGKWRPYIGQTIGPWCEPADAVDNMLDCEPFTDTE